MKQLYKGSCEKIKGFITHPNQADVWWWSKLVYVQLMSASGEAEDFFGERPTKHGHYHSLYVIYVFVHPVIGWLSRSKCHIYVYSS
jgi:hypothetical protein